MTHYFDEISSRLGKLAHQIRTQERIPNIYDTLRDIELKLEHEVNVCTEMPGFPLDIRDRIDHVFLTRGIYSRPELPGFPQGDAEDILDHIRKLQIFSEDLHTQFHEVARRGVPRFSDSPLCPQRCLSADAQNRRDNDAAAWVLTKKLLDWLLERST